VLIGNLARLVILYLSKPRLLNLTLEDSIIVNKTKAIRLSVVKGSLEEVLSVCKYLSVSCTVTTLNYLFIVFLQGLVN
jgi:hypothetical protein